MTDTNLVYIPWHDGTTREVPKGTLCLMGGSPVFAAMDGFTVVADGRHIADWRDHRVTKIYAEAPEPPEMVEVPTGVGAVVQTEGGALYFRHRHGWRNEAGLMCPNEHITRAFRDGGRVLSEGIDPEQVTA